MAKKIVRGITDIKTISNQDLDTNNVNDLLSDGEHSYIHRKKKDGSEEYHNLTNNIKTIEAEDNGLLTVRNYNNSTNSAKLTVHHDSQKEQLLESTDNTIVITHGENGTEETTSVDVNPAKVLEHDNLQTSYGISKTKSGNNTTLGLEYTEVDEGFDLNTLVNGNVRGTDLVNAPKPIGWFMVSTYSEGNYTIQRATALVDATNTTYVRRKDNGVWGEWREQTGDKSVIDTLLAQKEQLLESTDNTIVITHGENGTEETTTVDVNPAKVLTHDNLISNSDYVTIEHEENTSVISTDELDSEISELNSSVSTLNTDVTTINHRVADSSAIANPALLEGLYPIYHNASNYGANPDTSDLTVKYRDVMPHEVVDVTHTPSKEIMFYCVLGNRIADYTFNLNQYDTEKFDSLFRRFMDTPSYEEGKQIVLNGLVFSLTGNALTVSRTSDEKPRQVVSFSYIF